MSSKSDQSEIFVTFNSIQATITYKDLDYYRSSNIYIPPGYVALVELTTHKDYYEGISFTAIRTPKKTNWNECIADQSNCVGKIYRRWKCCQSLGENLPDTKFDDYNKSVVRWGYDKYTEEIVEFEWIDRPGNYYLMSMKCNSLPIADCKNPSIFEVSIMKASEAIQLGYSCYKKCDET